MCRTHTKWLFLTKKWADIIISMKYMYKYSNSSQRSWVNSFKGRKLTVKYHMLTSKFLLIIADLGLDI